MVWKISKTQAVKKMNLISLRGKGKHSCVYKACEVEANTLLHCTWQGKAWWWW